MKTRHEPVPHGEAVDPPAYASPAGAGTALQAELSTLQEQHRQLSAEFASFRKRVIRDSDQRAAEQKTALIRELLPVADNLERALTSPGSTSLEQLHRGIEMTHRELLSSLHRHGVARDDPIGLPFDPIVTRPSTSVSTRRGPTSSCSMCSSAVTCAARRSFVRREWS